MRLDTRWKIFGSFHRITPILLALGTIATCIVATLVFDSVSAYAVTAGPGWEVTSSTFPVDLSPAGGKGAVEINVYNIGSEPSHGVVTVTDILPPGVVAISAGDVQNGFSFFTGPFDLWGCSGNGPGAAPKLEGATIVSCTNTTNMPSLPIPEQYGSGIAESGGGAIEHLAIAVEAQTSRPGVLPNNVTVAGGGSLAPASASAPITISVTPASSFGFEGLDNWFSGTDGTVDTQAVSHPYEFVDNFDLNTGFSEVTSNLKPVGGEPRNLTLNLPPG